MSARDINQALQSPGRLCIAPTDLTLAFPHGGTELGSVYRAYCQQTTGYFDVKAEEYGGAIVESIWSGENYAFGAILRQWDETAIGTVFPNTATGATTKRVGVKHWSDVASSPVRPGHLLSSRSVKLLFSPDDPANCRAVILYRALPKVSESLTLALRLNERQEIPVLFVAIPDASASRVARVDFLKELSV